MFELNAVQDSGDFKEVFNYVSALNRVTAPDRRLPLSIPLLLEAHETLMQGVRGGYATPGEIRRSQNWIGPPGCTLSNATYVPPPIAHLWPSLDALEKYLYAADELPPLVRIGLLHYQFEAIHPLIDGNGRVGRLLIALLMLEWGLLPAPLLDMSAWIEPRRDEYYERLLRVSTHGERSQWLEFFIVGVASQAADAAARAQRLHQLREKYRHQLVTTRASAMLPQLVDSLFTTPAMTIPHARMLLDVTHRTATLHVERLVTNGVLIELQSPKRTRLFIAQEIIDTAADTAD